MTLDVSGWRRQIAYAWEIRLQGMPNEFEALHPNLLPYIRPRADMECARLQAAAAETFPTAPTFHVIAEHLGLALIYE